MAQKLYNFFLKAGELGGVQARTKLSLISKMTSMEAKLIADSDDKIKILEQSFETIAKEYGNSIEPTLENASVIKSNYSIVEKLLSQISTFAKLTPTRSVNNEALASMAKGITEALVEAINVERVSIWLYNDEQDAIECLDLFVRSRKEHSGGVMLKAIDFPCYFKTLSTQRTLAVENAHTHPGTAEFSEAYLRPLGINSMLDVPIYVNGKMAGIVCHEHTGNFRPWTTEEETFAYLMGNIIGVAIEKMETKKELTIL